MVLLTYFVII